jgi:hypothetical protein
MVAHRPARDNRGRASVLVAVLVTISVAGMAAAHAL